MRKSLMIPKEILVMQALLRRLPKNHEKRELIEEDLEKAKLKYEGMKKVYATLLDLDSSAYNIIPNLRLKINEEQLVIDFLLLTNRFAVIIDVYHFSGMLTLDQDSPHMVQIHNGAVKKIPNPILELEHKKDLLLQHFNDNQLPLLPIETLIVNTNPNCEVLFELQPNSPTLHKILVEKFDTVQEA